ncbi:MAG TPA: glycosyltransferase family 39 protein, partial [Thermoanaerobaculia bacterium]|nr:glycosyltransferase family 39 protein [Thermoanaerobaculia bacterium]
MTGATDSSLPDPCRPAFEAAARWRFLATLGAVLAYRFLLAATFPVLGDEAYLFTWAREPAWGYYDHPPLAAWLLRPLVAAGLGGSLFALRLPSVLLYPALAVALVALVRRLVPEAGPDRAYLAGTLFLLVPVHVVGVLMLTDVPLVLCSFLAVAALCLAERPAEGEEGRGALGWYATAGVFLGLALLAKYFAALVGAAFLVWFLSAGWTRRRVAGFALLVACALPFVLVHLAWNATHCWSTVAFNLYSRHAGEGRNYNIPRNLLVYAGTLLYLAGPPLLWSLGRRWRRWAEALRSPGLGPAALAFLVPMSLLLASAAALLFGAYWMLPFVPFLFLLAPGLLERRE